MNVGRGPLDPYILAAQLKDFTGTQPHLDHDHGHVPENWRRCVYIFSFLIEGKDSFSSFFMQELDPTAEEETLLDQFLLHSNSKDLPQTGQVAVNRCGTPLLLEARLLEGADHLGSDLIEIFPAKYGFQVTDTTQVGAMGVAPAFYTNCVEKTLCKIPEQRNLLFGKDPCASLGQFCLLDALNAVSNGLVSEMSGGLISPPFEIEVVVVIRRAGLLVDGHWVLQTVKNWMNSAKSWNAFQDQ
jgi:hypothetical protein